MKDAITLLLSLFVGFFFGIILTRSCSQPKEVVTEIITTDTLIVQKVDTIKIVKPKPYKVVVRDTVYIQVPQVLVQEVKEYKGKDYYAKISGINAFLEEINVFPETVTKYVYKEKKVVESPDKWVLYGKAEYESITKQNFAKIGGGLEYKDKGNTFAAEGGKEFISGQWYFKGIYKRDIFGWK